MRNLNNSEGLNVGALIRFIKTKFIKNFLILDVILIVAMTAFACRRLTSEVPFGPGGDSLNTYLIVSSLSHDLSEYGKIFAWDPYEYNGLPAPLYIRPMYVFFGALAAIFGVTSTIKVLMVTSFLLAGFSMYLLSYHLSRSRLTSLTAAIVYTYNQYFIRRTVTGQYSLMIGHALAPLVFLTYEKALKSGGMRDILLAAVILTVFLSSHPHSIYILMIFLPLYISFFFFFKHRSDSRKTVLKKVAKSAVSLVISFLLSIYWVIPLLVTKPPVFEASFEIESADTFSCTLLDAIILRLQSRPLEHPLLSSQPYSLLLYCIPFLAFLAIFIRRNRYTISFTILAIFSIFLAKGPHEPLGQVFIWLWTHVPHFSTFRSAHRFLMITSLAYAFLTGVTLDTILNKIKLSAKSRLEGMLDYIILHTNIYGTSVKFFRTIIRIFTRNKALQYCLIIVSVIMLSVASSWVGVVETLGLPNYAGPPDEYVKPSEWISHQPGDFRVATVPISFMSKLGEKEDIKSYQKCFSVLYSKATLHGGEWWLCPSYTREFIIFLDEMIVREEADEVSKLLGFTNVRYLIVHSDDKTRGLLTTQMKEVYRSGETVILENPHWRQQHVFGAANQAIVFGGRKILTSLSDIEGFDFYQWALIFGKQLYDSPDAIIFSDFEFIDSIPTYGWEYLQKSETRLIYLLKREEAFELAQQKNETTTFMNMTVPRAGNYMLALRFSSNQTAKLTLTVDDQPIFNGIYREEDVEKFVWYDKIGPIFLDEGDHDLAFESTGAGSNVDELVIYSLKEGEAPLSLSDVFATSATVQTRYTMINPCEYLVHVNTTKPFMLVFIESYNPSWRACVDNIEIRPILTYSFVNGFYINKTGEFNVSIRYTGQDYLEMGSVISIISGIMVAACFFYPFFKRLLRHEGEKEKII